VIPGSQFNKGSTSKIGGDSYTCHVCNVSIPPYSVTLVGNLSFLHGFQVGDTTGASGGLRGRRFYSGNDNRWPKSMEKDK
jgi:hypothetical protein